MLPVLKQDRKDLQSPLAVIPALAEPRNAEALTAASAQEQPQLPVFLWHLLPKHTTFSTQIWKLALLAAPTKND